MKTNRDLSIGCTDTVFMVPPLYFGFNPQTSSDNTFQRETHTPDATSKAMEEFSGLVYALERHGIQVVQAEKTSLRPESPDAVFPNNWVSFHGGAYVLYPMRHPNRRRERNPDVVRHILRHTATAEASQIDLSHYEKRGLFLEGTGSMILDRYENICYAAASGRTSQEVLEDFCSRLGFEACFFHTAQETGTTSEIYHTNVMMSLGNRYAIICLEAIERPHERAQVLSKLRLYKEDVLAISKEQLQCFLGNTLQLRSGKNAFIVMSSTAYGALSSSQKSALLRHGKIIHSDLSTIEALGGGSARCMMCEVFPPSRRGFIPLTEGFHPPHGGVSSFLSECQ